MVNWPIMWTELPATKGLKLLKTLKSARWTSSSCASAQKPMTFKGCKFNVIFTHAWKGLWWQTRLDLGIGQLATFQNALIPLILNFHNLFDIICQVNFWFMLIGPLLCDQDIEMFKFSYWSTQWLSASAPILPSTFREYLQMLTRFCKFP